MATNPTNIKNQKFRRTLKIGDLALYLMVRTSSCFKNLFFNTEKALWDALSFYGKLTVGLFAFFQTTLLRTKKGNLQGGLVPTTLLSCISVTANSTDIHYLWSGLGIFITPWHLFTLSGSEIYDFLFVHIHSKILLMATGLFLITGVWQSLQIYIKGGNTDTSSRGVSRFYTFLLWISRPKRGKKRTFHPKPFWCEFLFETITMTASGLISLYLFHDLTFALFCFSATLCEGFQTLDDYALQQSKNALLNA